MKTDDIERQINLDAMNRGEKFEMLAQAVAITNDTIIAVNTTLLKIQCILEKMGGNDEG